MALALSYMPMMWTGGGRPGDPPEKRHTAPRLSDQELDLIRRFTRAGGDARSISLGHPSFAMNDAQGLHDPQTGTIYLRPDSSRFTARPEYVGEGFPPFTEDRERHVLAHELAHRLDRERQADPAYADELSNELTERLDGMGASERLKLLANAVARSDEKFAEAGALSLLDVLYGRDALARAGTRTSDLHAKADSLSAALAPIITQRLQR